MIFLPTFFIKEKSWSFARGANETMACVQDLLNIYNLSVIKKNESSSNKKVNFKNKVSK